VIRKLHQRFRVACVCVGRVRMRLVVLELDELEGAHHLAADEPEERVLERGAEVGAVGQRRVARQACEGAGVAGSKRVA